MTEFAAPILAYIASRPPDIEDDFEQPSRAWVLEDWCGDWRKSYENGEMVITECSVHHSGMHFNDYVVEVDGHFMEGTNPDGLGNALGFQFRNGFCQYEVDYYGNVGAGCNNMIQGQNFGKIGYGAYRTNHLLLIVKGSRFAFYLNGQPVGYLEAEAIRIGDMKLGTRGGDYWDVIVAFDNFKAWRITDLVVP